MKKIDLKENKGITLVTLILAIIIMLIISSTLIYNAQTGIKTRALNNMYNDIKNLKDKIEIYYSQYGTIPIIKTQYTNVENIKGININDNNLYYVIDLEAINNLTLTYGSDYKTYKALGNSQKEDLYVINEKSHTIYYIQGIELEGKKYHTVPEGYTKIEIPEVNVIQLKEINKGVATVEINASNKDIGIQKIRLYKGNTIYKTYEYTDKTKERKKEIIDIMFVVPEESEWHIETIDANGNSTNSNTILIKSDYYLKVAKPEDKNWDETKIDCYQDEEGNIIPVPKGFAPILKSEGQGTKNTGFVIKDMNNNAETRGNEFVWVPVEGMPYTYGRYAFLQNQPVDETDPTKIKWGATYFTEDMPEDEQTSVNQYGGYYIGRYESRNRRLYK